MQLKALIDSAAGWLVRDVIGNNTLYHLVTFFFLPRLSNSNPSHVTFTKPSYKDPGWEILQVGCHKEEEKYKIPAYKA